MPSLSYRPGQDASRFVYFMPPIQYPDGKHYLKIGHSKGEVMSKDAETLKDWFQGDGDPQQAAWLSDTLRKLLPNVDFASLHTRACVTTQSPTGKQFIDRFEDERFYALLADNGQCGKSADELGLIVANFVVSGQFPEPYQRDEYRIQYA